MTTFIFLKFSLFFMGLGKDDRAVGPLTNVSYPSMHPCIYLETTQFSLDLQAVENRWENVYIVVYIHVSMTINLCLGSSVCIQVTHSPTWIFSITRDCCVLLRTIYPYNTRGVYRIVHCVQSCVVQQELLPLLPFFCLIPVCTQWYMFP
jgi:hypothetical protein